MESVMKDRMTMFIGIQDPEGLRITSLKGMNRDGSPEQIILPISKNRPC